MSLLSVAPNSFTGMLTIPKPIDPLQIAFAIAPPPDGPVIGRVTAAVFHTTEGIIHRFINITC
jgi:hypothetical protein